MSEKQKAARIEGANPLKLKEMVGYQEGSIVSRIIHQEEAGTLTVFAFDEGQALSEHTVPFNAYIQVLEGEALITIGETPCVVREGEIVLMPGAVPHRVNAEKRFKMLLTMVKAPAR